MPQPLMRAQDVVATTYLKENVRVDHNVHVKSVDDITRANADNEAHPKYDTMDDWHGGTEGNDVDVSDATQAIVGRNGGTDNDYEPRHQEEKASKMDPVPELLSDIGYDYGEFGGLTGRDGPIEPFEPYPET